MDKIDKYEGVLRSWIVFLRQYGSRISGDIRKHCQVGITRWLEYRAVIKVMTRYVDFSSSPRKYMDIGCGYSIFPLWISSLGFSTTLFDLPVRKERLKLYENLAYFREHREELFFAYGDISKEIPGTGDCDFVTSISTFEHIDQDARAFQNLTKLLRPGGIAVLTFPISGAFLDWRSPEFYLEISKSFSPDYLREKWFSSVDDIEVLGMEYYLYDDSEAVSGGGWAHFANSFNCCTAVDEERIRKHLSPSSLSSAYDPFFQTTGVVTIRKKN